MILGYPELTCEVFFPSGTDPKQVHEWLAEHSTAPLADFCWHRVSYASLSGQPRIDFAAAITTYREDVL